MNQIRKRLTYANVMSSIAVFLVLGGAAFAAVKLPKNSVGTKQLKKNAVTAAKIKNGAVTAGKIGANAVDGSKLADNAVSNGKIADNAVTNGKIADSAVSNGKIADNAVSNSKIAGNAVSNGKIADNAVTAGKLAEGERSQAFSAEGAAGPSAELPKELSKPPLTVVTLNLPSGAFVVTAQTVLIRSLGEPGFTECILDDDGTELGEMADTYSAGLFFPSGGVSVSGVSNGGKVTLGCRSNTDKTFAFKEKIVAIRVGSVN